MLEEVDEGDAIIAIDRFALRCRLPDGQTVVDRFVASRPDLTAADRETRLADLLFRSSREMKLAP